MPELRAAFPDALYLHLHRDGSETALSREHPRLRVALYFGFRRRPSKRRARSWNARPTTTKAGLSAPPPW